MIIETTDNRFYRVWETNEDALDHVWYGVQVKKVRPPVKWEDRVNNVRVELVRKEASRVVEA